MEMSESQKVRKYWSKQKKNLKSEVQSTFLIQKVYSRYNDVAQSLNDKQNNLRLTLWEMVLSVGYIKLSELVSIFNSYCHLVTLNYSPDSFHP